MQITTPDQSYDVVIAGGGLVGGSFALLLASRAAAHGLTVLLLDAAPLHAGSGPSDEGFDARSTALSWGSQLIYRRAGLWPALAPYGCRINDIHVSDRGHFGAVRLHSADLKVEALGYVLENQHLTAVINRALLEHKGVQVAAQTSVQKMVPTASGTVVDINMPDGRTMNLHTRLLVLADGGRSGLCEQAGIRLERHPYGQQALICNIAFEKPHRGLAFERFTDTGPMAVLPLHGETGADDQHRGALVWTLADAEAQTIAQLPEAQFRAALQQRFGWRLGAIIKTGARSLYPLALSLAKEQIRPGMVLLGNVAHTLHPVAGQGLNLALRDADTLAALLAGTVAEGSLEQLGNYAVLEQFLHRQASDQYATVMFSDLTTRVFSSSNPALAAGRNLGLLMMELLPPAKQWFARQAMGLR
jgi:2-octaprenyl-6-methoxyphenol hydroxylase